MSKIINEKLFEQIFDNTFIKLANKLINTKSKEENQVIVNNIKENKEKLFKKDKTHDYVIQLATQHVNLIHAIKLILDFNETI